MMHPGLFGQLVEDTIKKANSGDAEAAKKLMQWYCGGLKTTEVKKGVSQRVNRKPSIDERILRYFGECFEQILEGVKVERAMSLEKSEGAQSNPKLKERDIDLAIDVEHHIQRGKIEAEINPRRIKKKSKTDIYNDVALNRNKSASTVKAAYLENSVLAEQVVAVDLPSLLAELDAEDKKG